MLDTLTDKFSGVFRALSGRGRIRKKTSARASRKFAAR